MLHAYLTDPPEVAPTAATEPSRRRQQAVAELEALEGPVLAWLRTCCAGFGLFGAAKFRLPCGASDTLEPDQLVPANHTLLGAGQRTWLETFWSGDLAHCLLEGFGIVRQQQQQQQQQRCDAQKPAGSTAWLARCQHQVFLDRLAELLGPQAGMLHQLAYQPADLVDNACAGRPFSHDQVLSVWRQALSALLLFMAAAGEPVQRLFEPAGQVSACPHLLAVTRRLQASRLSSEAAAAAASTAPPAARSLRRLSWQWAKFTAAREPGQQLELDKFHRSVTAPAPAAAAADKDSDDKEEDGKDEDKEADEPDWTGLEEIYSSNLSAYMGSTDLMGG